MASNTPTRPPLSRSLHANSAGNSNRTGWDGGTGSVGREGSRESFASFPAHFSDDSSGVTLQRSMMHRELSSAPWSQPPSHRGGSSHLTTPRFTDIGRREDLYTTTGSSIETMLNKTSATIDRGNRVLSHLEEAEHALEQPSLPQTYYHAPSKSNGTFFEKEGSNSGKRSDTWMKDDGIEEGGEKLQSLILSLLSTTAQLQGSSAHFCSRRCYLLLRQT
eukprot:1206112-Rhodomonas_salina.1